MYDSSSSYSDVNRNYRCFQIQEMKYTPTMRDILSEVT